MKNSGQGVSSTGEHRQAAVSPVHLDGKTRREVARLLLEHGPMAAVAVAAHLGISPTAIRRHLDVLLADGDVEIRDASRRGPRGRGRPAKLFLLTERGRGSFGHAYDHLAVSALKFLSEREGEAAVRAFAEHRVQTLVGPHLAAITRETNPAAKAKALASALTSEGYAASTRRVGAGEQLCQHHCPVAHVAAEFPQLCEAETEAFAKLLGTHVQRLATIARGDAGCTTHIPVLAAGEVSKSETATKTASTVERTVSSANGGHSL